MYVFDASCRNPFYKSPLHSIFLVRQTAIIVTLCRKSMPLAAYTTLCRPSVFSISSITPRVATISSVASAAIVGSK